MSTENFTKDEISALVARIKQAFNVGTEAKIAEILGIKQTALSQQKRRGAFPVARLARLCSQNGINVNWLLTGEGPMNDVAPPEPSNVSPAPRSRIPSRDIPLISWVQAGGFVDPQAQTTPGYAEEWVETSATNSSSAFALMVSGDSMEPEFRDGDIITVDPDRVAVSGNYVVVKNGHEATFKQLVMDGQNVYLKPLNDRYPIKDMTGIEFRIVGVVVEKRKRY